MSLNAQAIRLLVEKGLTAADIADIAEANAPVRSSSAERQKRYRANGGDKIGEDLRTAIFERDGLNGVVWKDDSQVASWRLIKVYGDTPGLHVTVTAL